MRILISILLVLCLIVALILANVIELTHDTSTFIQSVARTLRELPASAMAVLRIVYEFLGQSAVGTLVAIIFGIAGLWGFQLGRTRDARKAARPDQSEDESPYLEPMELEESIHIYFSGLTERLSSDTLTAQYVEFDFSDSSDPSTLDWVQSFELRENRRSSAVDISTAHDEFRTYVLLGEPGSGKSTCLKYLALKQIEKIKKGQRAPVPLFINLGEWKDKRMTAVDFFRSELSKQVSVNNYIYVNIEEMLARGEFLLLLDGLNEIPGRVSTASLIDPEEEDDRDLKSHVVERNRARNLDSREESLRRLATSHAVASKFVVSCRSHEFAGSIEWKRIHVLPMTNDQIRLFVGRYVDESRQDRLADFLFPEGDVLSLDIARNPFYLSQLTLLVDQEGLAAVSNRGQFLTLLLTALLDRDNVAPSASKRFVRKASKVAYRMVKQDLIGSRHSLSRWFDESDRKLGLGIGFFFESEGEIYWRHQLLQEFMAAQALVRKPSWALKGLIVEEKWSEIIILYHDLAPNSSAALGRIIRLLSLRNGLTSKPSRAGWHLLVMVTATIGYGFVTADFIVDLFVDGFWWGLLKEHPWVSLLYLSFPFLLHFLLPALSYNRAAIGNAAYVLSRVSSRETRDTIVEALILAFPRMGMSRSKISQALVGIGPEAVPMLMDALRSRSVSIVKGCLDALGKIRDPSSLKAIRGVLERGDYRVYHACYTCLAEFKSDHAKEAIASTLPVIHATADIGPPTLRLGWWSQQMIAAFNDQSKPDDELAERLLEVARTSDSLVGRHLALICAAAHGHPIVLEELNSLAQNPRDPMRLIAISAMAFVRSEDAVDRLVDIVRTVGEDDEKPRELALQSLRSLTYEGAVPRLIELLADQQTVVQDSLLTSISYLAQPSDVPSIMEHYDALHYSRSELALCLGRIGGDEAIDGLVRIARDDDNASAVRQQSLDMLDARFPDQCINDLLRMLRDQDFPERSKVLILLSNRPPLGSEFSDILTKIIHSDPDLELAREARRVQRHLNQGLRQRLQRLNVSFASKRIWAIKPWLREKFGIDEWNRICNEVDLSDSGRGSLIHNTEVSRRMQIELLALAKAKTDPDAWRKVRYFIWFRQLMFFSMLMAVGAIPVLVYHSLAGIGEFALQKWPYALGVVSLAVVAYLTKLGEHNKWYLSFANYAIWLATSLMLVGLVFALVPWLVGTVFGWLYNGAVYLADLVFQKPVTVIGAAVLCLVLSLILGRARGAMRSIGKLLFAALVVIATGVVLGLAFKHWTYTLGALLVLFAFLLWGLRRKVRKRRARRRQQFRDLMNA